VTEARHVLGTGAPTNDRSRRPFTAPGRTFPATFPTRPKPRPIRPQPKRPFEFVLSAQRGLKPAYSPRAQAEAICDHVWIFEAPGTERIVGMVEDATSETAPASVGLRFQPFQQRSRQMPGPRPPHEAVRHRTQ
jgi:hypothetical protein